jgi:hypothetical protein
MAQLSVICTSTAGGSVTALIGADGITVISGVPTPGQTTISGFYDEFVGASGSLQSQITAGGVTDLNSLTGSVVLDGAGEVALSIDGQTITISGTPHTGGGGGTVSAAMVGADGITVLSGVPTASETTISGFRIEFVNASGSLQNEIDATQPDVDSLNTLTGDITITGSHNFPIRTEGQAITVSGADFIDNLTHAYDGGMLRHLHTHNVTSDGTTITYEFDRADGLPTMPVQISGSNIHHPVPDTVTLTPATVDTNPQENWVYLLQSGDSLTLTNSTTDFPTTPHARVARVIVQTASGVAASGVLKLHAYTDHVAEPDSRGNIGHIHAISERIRAQFAEWQSGSALTTTPDIGSTASTITVQVTTGVVYQLHSHATPAFDTAGSDLIFVPNDFDAPYRTIQSLSELDTYSGGDSIGVGDRFNVVVWGVVAENDADSKLFLNMPSEGYLFDDAATDDANNTAVYAIPKQYAGVGWLLARLTVKRTLGGGTWEIIDRLDLRGALPSAFPGGVAVGGGGVTDHGLLTGLTPDDDHPHYVLADGTRGFSGTVSGVDPVDSDDLTTKNYVDTQDTSISGHLDTTILPAHLFDLGNVTVFDIGGGDVAISGHTMVKIEPGLVDDPGLYFSHDPATGIYSRSVEEIDFTVGNARPFSLFNTYVRSLRQHRFDDGTAADPGLTFTDDAGKDTGIYLKAEDVLGFSAGAIERVTVSGTASGTDGVGINGNLTVTGTVAADAGIFSDSLTVSGIPVSIGSIDEIEPALVGEDGITIISGTSTTTVSGFREEFLSASGTLVKKTGDTMTGLLIAGGGIFTDSLTGIENLNLDGILTATAVDATQDMSIAGAPVAAPIVGADGITVISGVPSSEAVTISGFRDEFVNASGSLQTAIDDTQPDVDSINTLTGDVTVTGVGEVNVTGDGQNIVVSGTPHAPRLLATMLVDAPNDEEDLSIMKVVEDTTIESMYAVIRGPGSPSVTWTIRHWWDRSATGTEVVTAGTTTSSTTSGDTITALSGTATITGSSWVWLETTVTGGSPQELIVELYS